MVHTSTARGERRKARGFTWHTSYTLDTGGKCNRGATPRLTAEQDGRDENKVDELVDGVRVVRPVED